MNSPVKSYEMIEESLKEKKSKTSEKKSVTFKSPLSSVYLSDKNINSNMDNKTDFDQINEEEEHNYTEMIDKVKINITILNIIVQIKEPSCLTSLSNKLFKNIGDTPRTIESNGICIPSNHHTNEVDNRKYNISNYYLF